MLSSPSPAARKSRATEWQEALAKLQDVAIRIDSDLSQACHMLGTPIPVSPNKPTPDAPKEMITLFECMSDGLSFLAEILYKAEKKAEALRMEVFLSRKEV
jgi:hypothetical protein